VNPHPSANDRKNRPVFQALFATVRVPAGGFEGIAAVMAAPHRDNPSWWTTMA
jgi:hypothetical protein